MKNIVITGAAGYIGSNLSRLLLANPDYNVFLVERLETLTDKFDNIKTLYTKNSWVGHEQLNALLERLTYKADEKPTIIHLGANSSTLENDVAKILEENTNFTKLLIKEWATKCNIIIASSASVYGNRQRVSGSTLVEPLSPYAYSKYLVDLWLKDRPYGVVSLRFFNVYGLSGEEHKKGQQSPFFTFKEQFQKTGEAIVYELDEKIERDFVHVSDVCRVIQFFIDNPTKYGIYDVGTGQPKSFEQVARVVSRRLNPGTRPTIKYEPMPWKMAVRYQIYTRADLTALRAAGYDKAFYSIEDNTN